jgi:hypothetical protein
MTSSNVHLARPSAYGSLAPVPRRARFRLNAPRGVLLGALALGCTSEGVDLGGGLSTRALTGESRCVDSPIIEGSVRVTSQEELAALLGCEEIRGDLDVQLFPDADLTPLSSLRVVESVLVLGDSALDLVEDFDDAAALQAIEDREAPLRGNWLTSLRGLESLESVGGLLVADTAIVDLEPLSQLRNIGGGGSEPSQAGIGPGELYMFRNPLLRDLTGLENARGVVQLQLFSNPALESLSALPLGPDLVVLNLAEVPALTDIDALATVKNIDTLNLDGTGLVHLDALSALENATSNLFILNNPALVDASGLGGVQQSQSLLFTNNASLKTLPTFSSLTALPNLVTITDNPELEELTLDLQLALASSLEAGGVFRLLSMDSLRVANNERLRSVALSANFSEVFGLHDVQIVALEDNPSLVQIDFGGLQRVDLLSIGQNPALTQVELGALATVDSLRVIGNASLDANVFASLRTFERESSGNAIELSP